MTFLGWVEYPSMMVSIHQINDCYECVKYVDRKKLTGGTRQFVTKEELQDFLLTLPSAPTDFVFEFIKNL